MNEKSRPEAASQSPAEASAITVPQPDDGSPAWAVVREAENVLALESLALEALGLLTVEQLRALVWIGLLDEGWCRLFAELRRRGEQL